MIALGFLAQATIGSSTVVDGLACTQTSPATMVVNVGPGSIFSVATIDPNAYGSLGTNAAPLVKQGINTTTTPLTLTAPTTSGYSVNYLIEAAFSETDAGSTVLAYYNAANPSVAWSGPTNSGSSQNTKRSQTVSLIAKAGVAAATGTQTTPAADSGYTGLYVVTVAYGATTVTTANISTYPGAPFIALKLPTIANTVAVPTNFQVLPAGLVGNQTGNQTASWTVAGTTVTFNGATTGAGGMDTGSMPVSGQLSIYAIYNVATGTLATLGCPSSTSAGATYSGSNMPAGYAWSKLIWTGATNGSGYFSAAWTQAGRTIKIPPTLLSSGLTASSYQSISLSPSVPTNATGWYPEGQESSATASNLYISATSSDSAGRQALWGSSSVAVSWSPVPILTSQTAYYKISAGATWSLYADGYDF